MATKLEVGGDKALVAGPLKKYRYFFAASLIHLIHTIALIRVEEGVVPAVSVAAVVAHPHIVPSLGQDISCIRFMP